jgi:dihydrofolate reductase
MTLVTAQMSVSLDGYYAGPKQGDADPSDLQSWLEGPEAAGFFRVTRWAIDAEAWRQRLGFSGGEQNVNSDIIAETYESAGAYVMGRRMADGGEIPWGDNPPFRAPVFVVTHRPRPTLHRQGGTSFTYVTDGIRSAIEQAREAAKNENVAIAGGGTLVRQVITLGLLDELDLHIARSSSATGCGCSTTDSNSTPSKGSSSHRIASPPLTMSRTSVIECANAVRSCWTTAGETNRRGWHDSSVLKSVRSARRRVGRSEVRGSTRQQGAQLAS